MMPKSVKRFSGDIMLNLLNSSTFKTWGCVNPKSS